MLVIKKIKKLENGDIEASWVLSSEEAGHLLSFAINNLIGEGLVRVEERSEGELNENQQQLDFLSHVQPANMGKA